MPLAEKIKNLSSICKMCGANASFTFKYEAQQQSPGLKIEIGGADMYMPLCRECFNEKTRQKQAARKQINSSLLDSDGKIVVAFNSSTTLAESLRCEDSAARGQRSDFASTSEKNGSDPLSSAETQKNAFTTATLFDMKQARSAIEGEGDNEPDGPKTKEVNR